MKEEILQAAIAVSRRVGFLNLTRALIAAELGRSVIWFGNQGVTVQELVRSIQERANELGVTSGIRPPQGYPRTHRWASTVRQDILQAAVSLLRKRGQFTRAEVAEAVGVAHGTVSNHFGGMANLRREAMAQLLDT